VNADAESESTIDEATTKGGELAMLHRTTEGSEP